MLRMRTPLALPLRKEDKYPRRLSALGLENPGFMEITYGRKKPGG